MSNEQGLTDSKLYELALETKRKSEERRDDINKYYTTLFGAILAFFPFISDIKSGGSLEAQYNIRILLMIVSLAGLVMAISWILTLKRMHGYIKAIDVLLAQLEKKFQQSFITHIYSYLEQTNAPGHVTRQEMLVPYTFITAFAFTFLYSVAWMIF